jgi:hypothetical protein
MIGDFHLFFCGDFIMDEQMPPLPHERLLQQQPKIHDFSVSRRSQLNRRDRREARVCAAADYHHT